MQPAVAVSASLAFHATAEAFFQDERFYLHKFIDKLLFGRSAARVGRSTNTTSAGSTTCTTSPNGVAGVASVQVRTEGFLTKRPGKRTHLPRYDPLPKFYE